MTDAAELIAGDGLKAAALKFIGETRAKIEREQIGLRSIFDSWLTRVLTQLRISIRPAPGRTASAKTPCARPDKAKACNGICSGCGLFLDRWRQGRFVEYFPARTIGCSLSSAIRHRIRRRRAADLPRRSVADALARHTADEKRLRFRDVSGADRRASAANHFRSRVGLGRQRHMVRRHHDVLGIEGRVHSVDRVKAAIEHPRVEFPPRRLLRSASNCSIRSCLARNRIPGWSSKTPIIMSARCWSTSTNICRPATISWSKIAT